MTEFCISLAGIPIEVHATFPTTKDFCRNYLTDETPLFSVAVEQEHIDRIREFDRKSSILEGRECVEHSDDYLETLALCFVIMEKLIAYNTLLFHGSAIAIGGKAYLLTAKSGTGKTTHSKLLLKTHPDCHILNGDKPLLQFKDGKIYVCGSPWQGKEDYGVNEILPLEAVCVLERGYSNSIEEITLKSCFDTLLTQSHIPDGNANILSVIKLVRQFSSVKLFRLKCNMEDEAAFVSYNAMVKP